MREERSFKISELLSVNTISLQKLPITLINHLPHHQHKNFAKKTDRSKNIIDKILKEKKIRKKIIKILKCIRQSNFVFY